ncbi:MAG: CotS family spore coat protein, partial [Clostridia bacterium]|nr:CotS family spore coat protein [Clostridia bacterium]
QGLAAFHLASRGYVPPEGAQNSTKQAKWPEEYTAMRSNLKEWKEISQNTSARPDHSAYSNHAEAMIELADLALCLLENSPYFKLTAPGSDSIVLCHQDYGKGNALLTDDGVYVLDLDGVTYDLPVRDLRKIIGKRAEKRGRWAEADIEEVLQAYTAVNPLSAEIREILRIDLIFPHWFFGLTKNLFLKNKFLKPYEIDRIVKLEQAKLALLNVSG